MNYWIYFLIAFIVFDFCLVLYVFIQKNRKKGFSKQEDQYIRNNWKNVLNHFEKNPTRAILDADKILDYALKKKGFNGSLGEKLKKAGPKFSKLNDIWSAHKLRNRIAHELSEVNKKEAKKALKQFKKGLIDLGAKL